MTAGDPFLHIAPYYDPLMEHVDYYRWRFIATALSELLPARFRHADIGCGTGTLVNMLRRETWHSVGADISLSMLRAGRKQRGPLPLAAADLRALPFRENLDFVTCLFDSINFLLEESEVRQALSEFHRALRPGGLLYFDIVTERMVVEHFADQTWTEQHPGFSSTWSSTYDSKRAIANTRLRIHGNAWSDLYERIYPAKWLRSAIEEAGFTLLGCYDAHHWKRPGRHTTRIDFVAAKAPASELLRRYPAIPPRIQAFLKAQQ